MVYRGKPSKACQRCRDRKLRCNLQRPSCASCLRVGSECYGYRDTDTLRIADETQLVQIKAASPERRAAGLDWNSQPSFKLSHLPLDIQSQARQLFFAYYIAEFSRAWDFLYPHFDPSNAPEHISLSIDAASLAFLSHHMESPSALNLGRRKYVNALRKTNKVLQNPKASQRTSILEASLVLDLFEKITGPKSNDVLAQRAHVDGALALVKLRGLQDFTDPGGLKALTRLCLNAVVISITAGDRVPSEIVGIREHAAQYFDVSHPKWRLTGMTLKVTDLVSDITHGYLTKEMQIERCIKLEQDLQVIDREASPKWSYQRIYVDEDDDHTTLDGFYDLYPSRLETQMWNVLRFIRIILCDLIIESCGSKDDELCKQTYQTTALLVQEVCATVPQMIDCNGAAKHRLPVGATTDVHTHTLSHFFDTYILLLGLYGAAWSRGCSPRAKAWIIAQFDRMAEHFGMREAATVSAILKMQDVGARVGPWEVYKRIGSYAFAA